jgi:hypothetical protein
MRKLIYKLNNGTYTTSLKVAKQCGNPYKTVLIGVEEKNNNPSPVVQAMIEQFGYASKKFRNKVVLK